MDPVSRSHRTAQVRCRELACPGRREESSDHREFSIQFFKDCTTRASWFETARERFSGAAAGLIVVPANAGTHTPRPLDFGWKELTPPANIKPGGYGPLRSQGRRLRVVAAELVPVHLFGTASFVKQPAMRRHSFAIPPHVSRGFCAFVPPSRKQRAQGMPDARCTRGRLCSKKHRRQQPRVHRNSRHSLRNGFNGVLRALLGDHAWLPPSPARRRSVFATLAPASERQDHTTSPSAQTPFVRAMTALGDVRPSHPIHNVRDDREPPLVWERDESKE